MLRIYADFGRRDERGRVMLDTLQSMRDLRANHNQIAEGVRVLLYVPGEFEVEATLTFNVVWRASPDAATVRYLKNG